MALQMLFQSDMGKQDAEQVRRTFWAEHGTASPEVRGFADDLFRVATDRVGEIDGLIEKHAEHWRMERMAAVEMASLRQAIRSQRSAVSGKQIPRFARNDKASGKSTNKGTKKRRRSSS